MSNPSESLARTNSKPCSINQCSYDPKKILVGLVAVAAIGAVVAGILTLLAPYHVSLHGLNALGTPGGITFIAIGGTTLVLIALSACYFYQCLDQKNSITHPHEPADSIPSENPDVERQNAAIQIQSLFRGDIARSTLKKMQSEQELKNREEAARILQSACRIHSAQSQLLTLQTEKEQQKVEAALKAQVAQRAAQPSEKFLAYTAQVCFAIPKSRVPCRESFLIRSEDDIEAMIKKISDDIYQKHEPISIDFDSFSISDKTRQQRMEYYQRAPSAANLQFNMPASSNYLCIKAKPVAIEHLSDGRTQYTFANGIIETFLSEEGNDTGDRLFPDGRQEKGKFHEGIFYSGYRITADGQIKFYQPESFASCKGNSKEIDLEICEVEGKLVVLEKKDGTHTVSDIPIYEVLIKAGARPETKDSDGMSIGKVLLHKDFENQLNAFIEFALGADASGTPRLFGLSNAAILDILEAGSKIKTIDPLKVIDPASKRTIFHQVAYWGNAKLLNHLIELFPHAFAEVGQETVAEFLHRGHQIKEGVGDEMGYVKPERTARCYDFLENTMLDVFHAMWLQIAKKEKPSENFKTEFALLSPEKQRTLYDAAFTYNNPFLHEPPDIPVRADQYSINLMWINKNKMPTEQEFLFGDGESPEDRQQDFHTRFVVPIAKWAQANPGSPINIWVDGEMAIPEAIERSRKALETFLEGTVHGTFQFRDVRSIEVVQKNAAAFDASVPIYFRVDLLRAIAADHALKNKETKYFVYGDIDMKPLTGQQLFDKKTVSFLDDFGIVMAKGGALGFENSFQILNGENDKCMRSHRFVIIDLNIEMALARPKAIHEEQIYLTYPAMLTHFLDGDGRFGKLDRSKLEIDDMQQRVFRHKIYRFDRFKQIARESLPLGDCTVSLRDTMPRKPVRVPPSHFNSEN